MCFFCGKKNPDSLVICCDSLIYLSQVQHHYDKKKLINEICNIKIFTKYCCSWMGLPSSVNKQTCSYY